MSLLGVLASCSAISLNDLTRGSDAPVDLDASNDAADVPSTVPDASDAGNASDARDASNANDADASGACPSLPATWTSARIADADAGCSSGLLRTFLKNPRSAADACDCSCQGAPSNPCEYAGAGYSVKYGSYGPGTCANDGSIVSAGCINKIEWGGSVTSIGGAPRPPRNVACPASAALPAIVEDERIDVCLAGNWEKTCGAGACVMHEGTDRLCPDGFPLRRELTAPEDVKDGRSCGDACACQTSATACIEASVTFFYSDDKCMTGGSPAILDGTCRSFSGVVFSPSSYQYHAKPDVTGCSPTSPTTTLTGTITSKKQITLCCADP